MACSGPDGTCRPRRGRLSGGEEAGLLDIRRREFIALLGGAAAWPLAARGQQGERARRIGVLMPESEDKPESQARAVAFERRLQELGLIPGRNLQIDYRWGMGEVEKARAATADLLKLTPSVLIAVASPATAAMQRTTRTIPIVFVAVSELVAQGLVASLAHPGGNLQPARQFQRRRSWRPAGEPIRPPALAVDRAQAKISSNSQT